MSYKKFVATVAFAAATLAATPSAADVDAEKAALQQIRAVSARYHSLTQAEKGGFLATNECVAVPGLGGMGYHYVNPARIDTKFDIAKPEVLLYETAPNGKRRLTGVEYLVVDADQNLATAGDRPILAGHPFDGPMPGHAPGMPIHYDLHVWTWANNPEGDFATWNPAISCP